MAMEESTGDIVRSPIEETALEESCPLCGLPSLVQRSLAIDLPYFGDARQTTVLCRSCSYRHSDLVLEARGLPVRYELQLGADDLAARVVRSASGTIRIPELGVRVDPGPRAEAFVSNAEGVLARVRAILTFAARGADSPASSRKAERAITKVDDMLSGRETFTLILEDPTGNSAILHERAKRRVLTPEDARGLQGRTELRAES